MAGRMRAGYPFLERRVRAVNGAGLDRGIETGEALFGVGSLTGEIDQTAVGGGLTVIAAGLQGGQDGGDPFGLQKLIQ